MTQKTEELFVRRVDLGVADMDVSTEDGATSTRVVVQRTMAADRETGEDRELLLVYGAEEVPAVADGLRRAAEVATSES